MAAGPELLARTQYRYFSEHSSALNSLINSLVSENWAEVVKNSDIKCWKEALVGIFTNSSMQERSDLCGKYTNQVLRRNNYIYIFYYMLSFIFYNTVYNRYAWRSFDIV